MLVTLATYYAPTVTYVQEQLKFTQKYYICFNKFTILSHAGARGRPYILRLFFLCKKSYFKICIDFWNKQHVIEFSDILNNKKK